MFQYRQVLVRLRAGDTVREIARSGLMGRDKLGELHAVAQSQGWLDAGADVPDDQAIIAALGPARRASSTVSSAEPHRAAVKAWLQAPTRAATRPSCACCASCATRCRRRSPCA